MANKKITSLTALGVAPATNDLIPIVDISDTTDSAGGTTKKITVANIFTTPTIGSFTNATHNHEDAAGGGQIDSDALSGAVSIAKGGTGQTTQTAAFDALAPTTTAGDIIYHNGSDNIRLAKGTAGQSLVMNSGATAPEWGGASIFPTQDYPVHADTLALNMVWLTSGTDGVMFFTRESSAATTVTIYRMIKDSKTGTCYATHSTTLSCTSVKGIAVIGNLVYVSAVISAANALRRYSTTDLSGVTTVTFSGTSRAGNMWSDGTDLYIYNGTTHEYDRFTISGTVATNAGAVSYTASNAGVGGGAISDGTHVWILDPQSPANIRKYLISGGSAISTLTMIMEVESLYITNSDNLQGRCLFWAGNTSLLGIGWGIQFKNSATIQGWGVHLTAITTP